MWIHWSLVAGKAVSIAFAATVVACASTGKPEPKSTPVALQALVLHDVGGLLGGKTLFLRGDGKAICQDIYRGSAPDHPMLEKRYRMILAEQAVRALEDLLHARSIASLAITPRAGQPDGVLRSIAVTFANGKSVKVAMWAGQQNEDFNAVYLSCLKILRACTDGQPYFHGPYDAAWAPEGF